MPTIEAGRDAMPIRSFIAAMSLVTTVPVAAQDLGSLMGSALPGISKVGVGNAAGLLGYCVKNTLTGGAAATSVLGQLTGQPAVKESPGYAQGQLGQVLGGGTDGTQSTMSLGSLKGQLKTKACDLVLKRAGSFL